MRDLTARRSSREYDYSQDEIDDDFLAEEELRQEDRDDETRSPHEPENQRDDGMANRGI